jgi:phosphate-selective porin
MSFTDAVSRVSQIQTQIASLQTAFDPSVAAAATSQSTAATAATAPTATATATGSGSFASALAAAQDSSSVPAGATGQLTSDQQQFASRLAAQTGLDPSVISAWLLAEESGGAAQSRQAQNNNDWLNIGYTDSATYGSSDSIWSNPITAADATAGWLKGQNTIPGYGTASSGIQAILGTAGQPASVQISALQNSGWASSGYPSLPSLYQQVAG